MRGEFEQAVEVGRFRGGLAFADDFVALDAGEDDLHVIECGAVDVFLVGGGGEPFECGAEVVAKAPWQDGKLAYQIDNHKKGLHYLIYFKMDSSQTTEFTRLCKLSEVVVRHLLISHPEKLFTVMAEALSQHVTGQADTTPMGVNPDKPY